MYPYAHPGPASDHDMQQQQQQMDPQQQQMAMEQYYAAMQLNDAQLVHQQLVQQQQMIRHQGMFVQQQQYSYVPEFHQQFTHPSYYMPPPPRQQQIAWDGGGAPPPGERPPPRGSLRTEECRHFARGHCQRGVSCNFAHTTPKEKQAPDSQPVLRWPTWGAQLFALFWAFFCAHTQRKA